ncbi:MAG: hypothetical protein LIP01_08985 [Tannerellaceae bacterium]|nr:hypothetical protein [Tannerellaceae bacterium]
MNTEASVTWSERRLVTEMIHLINHTYVGGYGAVYPVTDKEEKDEYDQLLKKRLQELGPDPSAAIRRLLYVSKEMQRIDRKVISIISWLITISLFSPFLIYLIYIIAEYNEFFSFSTETVVWGVICIVFPFILWPVLKFLKRDTLKKSEIIHMGFSTFMRMYLTKISGINV